MLLIFLHLAFFSLLIKIDLVHFITLYAMIHLLFISQMCGFAQFFNFFLPFTMKKVDSKIKTSRNFLASIMSASNHVFASNVLQVHNAFILITTSNEGDNFFIFLNGFCCTPNRFYTCDYGNFHFQWDCRVFFFFFSLLSRTIFVSTNIFFFFLIQTVFE